MRKRFKAGGYITVEASFIFPIVFLVIIALLKFGFQIHNRFLDVSLTEYLKIEAESIEHNSYNPAIKGIDIKDVVNSVFSYTKERMPLKNSTFVRMVHVIKNHAEGVMDND